MMMMSITKDVAVGLLLLLTPSLSLSVTPTTGSTGKDANTGIHAQKGEHTPH